MRKNLAILDVETGGFSTEKNGVCEIALLIIDPDTLEVIEEFSTLIKPYTRADDTNELVSYKEDSMAVHGITIEDLENEGEEVAMALTEVYWVLDKNEVVTLVGHNLKAVISTESKNKLKKSKEKFAGMKKRCKFAV